LKSTSHEPLSKLSKTQSGNTMNITPNPSAKSIVKETEQLANQAASGANSVLHSGKQVANSTFDHLKDEIDNIRKPASALIGRLSDQVETAAHRGADAVCESSAELRKKGRGSH
jgi:hypothetical protein